MKKIIILILSFFLLHVTYAQQTNQEGIRFDQAANWKEVTEKAKKENKYIFVDCYATWCMPCKYMSQTIFPLPEVGNYFNERFVNVKIQMDRTPSDAPEIKKWYADAKYIDDTYAIGAYPTYLIFSPEGKALHRVVAISKTGPEFIAKIDDAFDPKKQYYTNVGEYKNHPGDSAFLRNAMAVAFNGSDMNNAHAIADYYYDAVKDPFAKDNLQIFERTVRSTKDRSYPLFLKQSEKVDAILGRASSRMVLGQVMVAEDIRPMFDKKDAPVPDWKIFFKEMKQKYPLVTDESLEFYKPLYYRIKRMVPEYEAAIVEYVNKYGNQFAPVDYNNNAWDVFLVASNPKVLEEALKWCKYSIDHVNRNPGGDYVNFVDTYANLWYKLGNKEEALKWEKLALEVAQKDNNEKKIQLFTKTIAKMEKGEKTWE